MPRTDSTRAIPTDLDLLIVHQFDAAQSSPGGIDTCIRGIARYATDLTIGIVGVDATNDPTRTLGVWEKHNYGGRSFWFMPVVRLDPSQQIRRIPHSARLVAGLARYKNRLPRSRMHQSHRMDVGVATHTLLRGNSSYFIHTQDRGLTGATSDSFWRYAGATHRALERWIVRRSSRVTVFNPAYVDVVKSWNPRARFSPTWFDPAVLAATGTTRTAGRAVWVGRLEVPKDPVLAVNAFAAMAGIGVSDTELVMIGDGSLRKQIEQHIQRLPSAVAARMSLRGRLSPSEVADEVSRADVFLMTSRAGYEGYPRVLVEAMAAGTIPIVTEGSDPGKLVREGITGFITSREPSEIANQLARAASTIDRSAVTAAVANLSAPVVIAAIYATEPT